MSAREDLLFEIGSEELPPRSLRRLADALLRNVCGELDKLGLAYGDCQSYATPRRLGLLIRELATAQADSLVEKRGPALNAAFTSEGQPTPAAEGFARSCGTTVAALQRLETDKGAWLVHRQHVAGRATRELLPQLLQQALAQLPIAKRMRWGSGDAEFVRPVHWIVLLLGNEVIPANLLGMASDRYTYGHRFHAPQAIMLAHANEYADKLRQIGKVVADYDEREAMILEAATQAAATLGGEVSSEDDLLEEIAALVEWPVAVTGRFDARFLTLPQEVLISTMQGHQRYFPVQDADGQLLPYFITFSNIESRRPAVVQAGNERVIVPRLSDAEFFWKQDRRETLASRVPALQNIVFQQRLGTLADKTQRLIQLAGWIAERFKAPIAAAQRAAQLAKADLLTSMVGEFPELQGIMGRHYALADGEAAEIATALKEHYWPKHAGGPVPATRLGQILALADKIDTLCGIFSVGLLPTGDKDPYALRRAALGILRILIEKRLDLDVSELACKALAQFPHEFDRAAVHAQVLQFINERLKHHTLEHGFSADEFEAVIAVQPHQPLDFDQRLHAVKAFRTLPEAESLASANKRIRNLLRKVDAVPEEVSGNLPDAHEQRLLTQLHQAAHAIEPLLQHRDYTGALQRLAHLRGDVDAFFDRVMVMVEDPMLRDNRLALLKQVAALFLRIADLSKLQD